MPPTSLGVAWQHSFLGSQFQAQEQTVSRVGGYLHTGNAPLVPRGWGQVLVSGGFTGIPGGRPPPKAVSNFQLGVVTILRPSQVPSSGAQRVQGRRGRDPWSARGVSAALELMELIAGGLQMALKSFPKRCEDSSRKLPARAPLGARHESTRPGLGLQGNPGGQEEAGGDVEGARGGAEVPGPCPVLPVSCPWAHPARLPAEVWRREASAEEG